MMSLKTDQIASTVDGFVL